MACFEEIPMYKAYNSKNKFLQVNATDLHRPNLPSFQRIYMG